MGVILLKERLRSWQWLPIILAASGVIYITLAYGQLPWIALGLALSFGLYGLVKKTAPLNSLYGLTLETGFLFLPAFVYLLILQSIGKSAFLHTGVQTDSRPFGNCDRYPLIAVCCCSPKNPTFIGRNPAIYCTHSSISDRCFLIS